MDNLLILLIPLLGYAGLNAMLALKRHKRRSSLSNRQFEEDSDGEYCIQDVTEDTESAKISIDSITCRDSPDAILFPSEDNVEIVADHVKIENKSDKPLSSENVYSEIGEHIVPTILSRFLPQINIHFNKIVEQNSQDNNEIIHTDAIVDFAKSNIEITESNQQSFPIIFGKSEEQIIKDHQKSVCNRLTISEVQNEITAIPEENNFTIQSEEVFERKKNFKYSAEDEYVPLSIINRLAFEKFEHINVPYLPFPDYRAIPPVERINISIPPVHHEEDGDQSYSHSASNESQEGYSEESEVTSNVEPTNASQLEKIQPIDVDIEEPSKENVTEQLSQEDINDTSAIDQINPEQDNLNISLLNDINQIQNIDSQHPGNYELYDPFYVKPKYSVQPTQIIFAQPVQTETKSNEPNEGHKSPKSSQNSENDYEEDFDQIHARDVGFEFTTAEIDESSSVETHISAVDQNIVRPLIEISEIDYHQYDNNEDVKIEMSSVLEFSYDNLESQKLLSETTDLLDNSDSNQQNGHIDLMFSSYTEINLPISDEISEIKENVVPIVQSEQAEPEKPIELSISESFGQNIIIQSEIEEIPQKEEIKLEITQNENISIERDIKDLKFEKFDQFNLENQRRKLVLSDNIIEMNLAYSTFQLIQSNFVEFEQIFSDKLKICKQIVELHLPISDAEQGNQLQPSELKETHVDLQDLQENQQESDKFVDQNTLTNLFEPPVLSMSEIENLISVNEGNEKEFVLSDIKNIININDRSNDLSISQIPTFFVIPSIKSETEISQTTLSMSQIESLDEIQLPSDLKYSEVSNFNIKNDNSQFENGLTMTEISNINISPVKSEEQNLSLSSSLFHVFDNNDNQERNVLMISNLEFSQKSDKEEPNLEISNTEINLPNKEDISQILLEISQPEINQKSDKEMTLLQLSQPEFSLQNNNENEAKFLEISQPEFSLQNKSEKFEPFLEISQPEINQKSDKEMTLLQLSQPEFSLQNNNENEEEEEEGEIKERSLMILDDDKNLSLLPEKSEKLNIPEFEISKSVFNTIGFNENKQPIISDIVIYEFNDEKNSQKLTICTEETFDVENNKNELNIDPIIFEYHASISPEIRNVLSPIESFDKDYKQNNLSFSDNSNEFIRIGNETNLLEISNESFFVESKADKIKLETSNVNEKHQFRQMSKLSYSKPSELFFFDPSTLPHYGFEFQSFDSEPIEQKIPEFSFSTALHHKEVTQNETLLSCATVPTYYLYIAPNENQNENEKEKVTISKNPTEENNGEEESHPDKNDTKEANHQENEEENIPENVENNDVVERNNLSVSNNENEFELIMSDVSHQFVEQIPSQLTLVTNIIDHSSFERNPLSTSEIFTEQSLNLVDQNEFYKQKLSISNDCTCIIDLQKPLSLSPISQTLISIQPKQNKFNIKEQEIIEIKPEEKINEEEKQTNIFSEIKLLDTFEVPLREINSKIIKLRDEFYDNSGLQKLLSLNTLHDISLSPEKKVYNLTRYQSETEIIEATIPSLSESQPSHFNFTLSDQVKLEINEISNDFDKENETNKLEVSEMNYQFSDKESKVNLSESFVDEHNFDQNQNDLTTSESNYVFRDSNEVKLEKSGSTHHFFESKPKLSVMKPTEQFYCENDLSTPLRYEIETQSTDKLSPNMKLDNDIYNVSIDLTDERYQLDISNSVYSSFNFGEKEKIKCEISSEEIVNFAEKVQTKLGISTSISSSFTFVPSLNVDKYEIDIENETKEFSVCHNDSIDIVCEEKEVESKDVDKDFNESESEEVKTLNLSIESNEIIDKISSPQNLSITDDINEFEIEARIPQQFSLISQEVANSPSTKRNISILSDVYEFSKSETENVQFSVDSHHIFDQEELTKHNLSITETATEYEKSENNIKFDINSQDIFEKQIEDKQKINLSVDSHDIFEKEQEKFNVSISENKNEFEKQEQNIKLDIDSHDIFEKKEEKFNVSISENKNEFEKQEQNIKLDIDSHDIFEKKEEKQNVSISQEKNEFEVSEQTINLSVDSQNIFEKNEKINLSVNNDLNEFEREEVQKQELSLNSSEIFELNQEKQSLSITKDVNSFEFELQKINLSVDSHNIIDISEKEKPNVSISQEKNEFKVKEMNNNLFVNSNEIFEKNEEKQNLSITDDINEFEKQEQKIKLDINSHDVFEKETEKINLSVNSQEIIDIAMKEEDKEKKQNLSITNHLDEFEVEQQTKEIKYEVNKCEILTIESTRTEFELSKATQFVYIPTQNEFSVSSSTIYEIPTTERNLSLYTNEFVEIPYENVETKSEIYKPTIEFSEDISHKKPETTRKVNLSLNTNNVVELKSEISRPKIDISQELSHEKLENVSNLSLNTNEIVEIPYEVVNLEYSQFDVQFASEEKEIHLEQTKLDEIHIDNEEQKLDLSKSSYFIYSPIINTELSISQQNQFEIENEIKLESSKSLVNERTENKVNFVVSDSTNYESIKTNDSNLMNYKSEPINIISEVKENEINSRDMNFDFTEQKELSITKEKIIDISPTESNRVIQSETFEISKPQLNLVQSEAFYNFSDKPTIKLSSSDSFFNFIEMEKPHLSHLKPTEQFYCQNDEIKYDVSTQSVEEETPEFEISKSSFFNYIPLETEGLSISESKHLTVDNKVDLEMSEMNYDSFDSHEKSNLLTSISQEFVLSEKEIELKFSDMNYDSFTFDSIPNMTTINTEVFNTKSSQEIPTFVTLNSVVGDFIPREIVLRTSSPIIEDLPKINRELTQTNEEIFSSTYYVPVYSIDTSVITEIDQNESITQTNIQKHVYSVINSIVGSIDPVNEEIYHEFTQTNEEIFTNNYTKPAYSVVSSIVGNIDPEKIPELTQTNEEIFTTTSSYSVPSYSTTTSVISEIEPREIVLRSSNVLSNEIIEKKVDLSINSELEPISIIKENHLSLNQNEKIDFVPTKNEFELSKVSYSKVITEEEEEQEIASRDAKFDLSEQKELSNHNEIVFDFVPNQTNKFNLDKFDEISISPKVYLLSHWSSEETEIKSESISFETSNISHFNYQNEENKKEIKLEIGLESFETVSNVVVDYKPKLESFVINDFEIQNEQKLEKYNEIISDISNEQQQLEMSKSVHNHLDLAEKLDLIISDSQTNEISEIKHDFNLISHNPLEIEQTKKKLQISNNDFYVENHNEINLKTIALDSFEIEQAKKVLVENEKKVVELQKVILDSFDIDQTKKIKLDISNNDFFVENQNEINLQTIVLDSFEFEQVNKKLEISNTDFFVENMKNEIKLDTVKFDPFEIEKTKKELSISNNDFSINNEQISVKYETVKFDSFDIINSYSPLLSIVSNDSLYLEKEEKQTKYEKELLESFEVPILQKSLTFISQNSYEIDLPTKNELSISNDINSFNNEQKIVKYETIVLDSFEFPLISQPNEEEKDLAVSYQEKKENPVLSVVSSEVYYIDNQIKSVSLSLIEQKPFEVIHQLPVLELSLSLSNEEVYNEKVLSKHDETIGDIKNETELSFDYSNSVYTSFTNESETKDLLISDSLSNDFTQKPKLSWIREEIFYLETDQDFRYLHNALSLSNANHCQASYVYYENVESQLSLVSMTEPIEILPKEESINNNKLLEISSASQHETEYKPSLTVNSDIDITDIEHNINVELRISGTTSEERTILAHPTLSIEENESSIDLNTEPNNTTFDIVHNESIIDIDSETNNNKSKLDLSDVIVETIEREEHQFELSDHRSIYEQQSIKVCESSVEFIIDQEEKESTKSLIVSQSQDEIDIYSEPTSLEYSTTTYSEFVSRIEKTNEEPTEKKENLSLSVSEINSTNIDYSNQLSVSDVSLIDHSHEPTLSYTINHESIDLLRTIPLDFSSLNSYENDFKQPTLSIYESNNEINIEEQKTKLDISTESSSNFYYSPSLTLKSSVEEVNVESILSTSFGFSEISSKQYTVEEEETSDDSVDFNYSKLDYFRVIGEKFTDHDLKLTLSTNEVYSQEKDKETDKREHNLSVVSQPTEEITSNVVKSELNISSIDSFEVNKQFSSNNEIKSQENIFISSQQQTESFELSKLSTFEYHPDNTNSSFALHNEETMFINNNHKQNNVLNSQPTIFISNDESKKQLDVSTTTSYEKEEEEEKEIVEEFKEDKSHSFVISNENIISYESSLVDRTFNTTNSLVSDIEPREIILRSSSALSNEIIENKVDLLIDTNVFELPKEEIKYEICENESSIFEQIPQEHENVLSDFVHSVDIQENTSVLNVISLEQINIIPEETELLSRDARFDGNENKELSNYNETIFDFVPTNKSSITNFENINISPVSKSYNLSHFNSETEVIEPTSIDFSTSDVTYNIYQINEQRKLSLESNLYNDFVDLTKSKDEKQLEIHNEIITEINILPSDLSISKAVVNIVKPEIVNLSITELEKFSIDNKQNTESSIDNSTISIDPEDKLSLETSELEVHDYNLSEKTNLVQSESNYHFKDSAEIKLSKSESFHHFCSSQPNLSIMKPTEQFYCEKDNYNKFNCEISSEEIVNFAEKVQTKLGISTSISSSFTFVPSLNVDKYEIDIENETKEFSVCHNDSIDIVCEEKEVESKDVDKDFNESESEEVKTLNLSIESNEIIDKISSPQNLSITDDINEFEIEARIPQQFSLISQEVANSPSTKQNISILSDVYEFSKSETENVQFSVDSHDIFDQEELTKHNLSITETATEYEKSENNIKFDINSQDIFEKQIEDKQKINLSVDSHDIFEKEQEKFNVSISEDKNEFEKQEQNIKLDIDSHDIFEKNEEEKQNVSISQEKNEFEVSEQTINLSVDSQNIFEKKEEKINLSVNSQEIIDIAMKEEDEEKKHNLSITNHLDEFEVEQQTKETLHISESLHSTISHEAQLVISGDIDITDLDPHNQPSDENHNLSLEVGDLNVHETVEEQTKEPIKYEVNKCEIASIESTTTEFELSKPSQFVYIPITNEISVSSSTFYEIPTTERKLSLYTNEFVEIPYKNGETKSETIYKPTIEFSEDISHEKPEITRNITIQKPEEQISLQPKVYLLSHYPGNEETVESTEISLNKSKPSHSSYTSEDNNHHYEAASISIDETILSHEVIHDQTKLSINNEVIADNESDSVDFNYSKLDYFRVIGEKFTDHDLKLTLSTNEVYSQDKDKETDKRDHNLSVVSQPTEEITSNVVKSELNISSIDSFEVNKQFSSNNEIKSQENIFISSQQQTESFELSKLSTFEYHPDNTNSSFALHNEETMFINNNHKQNNVLNSQPTIFISNDESKKQLDVSTTTSYEKEEEEEEKEIVEEFKEDKSHSFVISNENIISYESSLVDRTFNTTNSLVSDIEPREIILHSSSALSNEIIENKVDLLIDTNYKQIDIDNEIQLSITKSTDVEISPVTYSSLLSNTYNIVADIEQEEGNFISRDIDIKSPVLSSDNSFEISLNTTHKELISHPIDSVSISPTKKVYLLTHWSGEETDIKHELPHLKQSDLSQFEVTQNFVSKLQLCDLENSFDLMPKQTESSISNLEQLFIDNNKSEKEEFELSEVYHNSISQQDIKETKKLSLSNSMSNEMLKTQKFSFERDEIFYVESLRINKLLEISSASQHETEYKPSLTVNSDIDITDIEHNINVELRISGTTSEERTILAHPTLSIEENESSIDLNTEPNNTTFDIVHNESIIDIDSETNNNKSKLDLSDVIVETIEREEHQFELSDHRSIYEQQSIKVCESSVEFIIDQEEKESTKSLIVSQSQDEIDIYSEPTSLEYSTTTYSEFVSRIEKTNEEPTEKKENLSLSVSEINSTNIDYSNQLSVSDVSLIDHSHEPTLSYTINHESIDLLRTIPLDFSSLNSYENDFKQPTLSIESNNNEINIEEQKVELHKINLSLERNDNEVDLSFEEEDKVKLDLSDVHFQTHEFVPVLSIVQNHEEIEFPRNISKLDLSNDQTFELESTKISNSFTLEKLESQEIVSNINLKLSKQEENEINVESDSPTFELSSISFSTVQPIQQQQNELSYVSSAQIQYSYKPVMNISNLEPIEIKQNNKFVLDETSSLFEVPLISPIYSTKIVFDDFISNEKQIPNLQKQNLVDISIDPTKHSCSIWSENHSIESEEKSFDNSEITYNSFERRMNPLSIFSSQQFDLENQSQRNKISRFVYDYITINKQNKLSLSSTNEEINLIAESTPILDLSISSANEIIDLMSETNLSLSNNNEIIGFIGNSNKLNLSSTEGFDLETETNLMISSVNNEININNEKSFVFISDAVSNEFMKEELTMTMNTNVVADNESESPSFEYSSIDYHILSLDHPKKVKLTVLESNEFERLPNNMNLDISNLIESNIYHTTTFNHQNQEIFDVKSSPQKRETVSQEEIPVFELSECHYRNHSPLPIKYKLISQKDSIINIQNNVNLSICDDKFEFNLSQQEEKKELKISNSTIRDINLYDEKVPPKVSENVVSEQIFNETKLSLSNSEIYQNTPQINSDDEEIPSFTLSSSSYFNNIPQINEPKMIFQISKSDIFDNNENHKDYHPILGLSHVVENNLMVSSSLVENFSQTKTEILNLQNSAPNSFEIGQIGDTSPFIEMMPPLPDIIDLSISHAVINESFYSSKKNSVYDPIICESHFVSLGCDRLNTRESSSLDVDLLVSDPLSLNMERTVNLTQTNSWNFTIEGCEKSNEKVNLFVDNLEIFEREGTSGVSNLLEKAYGKKVKESDSIIDENEKLKMRVEMMKNRYETMKQKFTNSIGQQAEKAQKLEEENAKLEVENMRLKQRNKSLLNQAESKIMKLLKRQNEEKYLPICDISISSFYETEEEQKPTLSVTELNDSSVDIIFKPNSVVVQSVPRQNIILSTVKSQTFERIDRKLAMFHQTGSVTMSSIAPTEDKAFLVVGGQSSYSFVSQLPRLTFDFKHINVLPPEKSFMHMEVLEPIAHIHSEIKRKKYVDANTQKFEVKPESVDICLAVSNLIVIESHNSIALSISARPNAFETDPFAQYFSSPQSFGESIRAPLSPPRRLSKKSPEMIKFVNSPKPIFTPPSSPSQEKKTRTLVISKPNISLSVLKKNSALTVSGLTSYGKSQTDKSLSFGDSFSLSVPIQNIPRVRSFDDEAEEDSMSKDSLIAMLRQRVDGLNQQLSQQIQRESELVEELGRVRRNYAAIISQ
ncbi:hypothetical protein TVAG_334260 [Trichomonas vaginalis G3]|uniref:Uncharacterized protein n=1 Tax=Trichomonas vaginalis (strain ATCC PRA-98 / G3) TaxID=412133 RepID=A2EID2_TRIV3|nr:hypothetical protein TVAGG3_0887720 [Trichomonas vaginalis G3]EAY07614.1 hypothetical protein TVAG_334260 [Trichomonas vaginalis G3]KAI5502500.1 hypothetical protein TVAGG3_0887720 [Trichomonas vaginalis G3]|eukprot:XP_001319837.1 hypothetical protein [Trichomonas vaginalis G3]